MLLLPAAALCCLCSALVAMAAQLIQDDLTLTRRVGQTASFSCQTDQRNSFVYWYQKKETFRVILRIDTNNDEQVVKPVVSVYPAASRAHLEGKSSLLCLASAMFPPLVRFSWKRQKKDGLLEELPPAEGEQLELREPGRTAAILLLRHQQDSTYRYSCYVKHEGGTVEAQTQQEDFSFQSECQVKLLCLLSTVLIEKSLVFCCGLSLLIILRNKGASTNCTHAD